MNAIDEKTTNELLMQAANYLISYIKQFAHDDGINIGLKKKIFGEKTITGKVRFPSSMLTIDNIDPLISREYNTLSQRTRVIELVSGILTTVNTRSSLEKLADAYDSFSGMSIISIYGTTEYGTKADYSGIAKHYRNEAEKLKETKIKEWEIWQMKIKTI